MKYILLLFALAACGPRSKPATGGGTSNVVIPRDVPDPFVVTRLGGDLAALAADADFVYWADESGIWRRPHGPDAKAERLLATQRWVAQLAPAGEAVFALDDSYELRGLEPGQAAASVAQLETMPWGLASDGNRAIVGVEDRLEIHAVGDPVKSIALPGIGLALAASDGKAFAVVSGDRTVLLSIDLASRKVRTLAETDPLSSASSAAVWGDRILVATYEGLHAYSLSGELSILSPLADGRVAADAAGWVLLPSAAIAIAHGPDGVTRALTPGLDASPLGTLLAVGDVWAYTPVYDETGMALLAMPRFGGGALWNIPQGGTVTACADAGERLVCSITTIEGEHVLVELDHETITHRYAVLESPCERIALEGDEAACLTYDGVVFRVGRTTGRAERVADVILGSRIALHKSRVYLSQGDQISIATRGEPKVIASGPVTRDYPENASLGTDMVFADDKLYFVSSGGPSDGVYVVDERGDVEQFWGYNSDRGLQQDLIRIGDSLYVQDISTVIRVPLDGTRTSVVHDAADRRILALHRAGDRIVAEIEGGPTGTSLIAIATPGHQKATWWTAPYDGVSGGDALIIRQSALSSVVAIEP